jgi:septal ring factor EnvC (AmiA/AmiB activator)
MPMLVIGQNSEPEIENKMSVIKKKLSLLKGKLNAAYGEERLLLGKLEIQDKAINLLSKDLTNSRKQLGVIQKEIAQLNQTIEIKEDSIERQKNQIINLLKLQVFLNHDKALKMLLLSPKNKSSIQTKHQIKYLQFRFYNLIKEVAEQIVSLKLLETEQLELQEHEKSKQEGLATQQEELLLERENRLQLLKLLKNEIAKHETESEGLNKDQKRLKSLLDEIRHLLSDLPSDLGSNKPFRKLKGRMKKPVIGKYIRSFHSRRSENTRWNGVVIQADIGSEVNAIAYGRIAFADWLRGFGMLVIVDHQDSYMSLYGFNESINVEVGDWVDSGQPIATIGNSGTIAIPALYFEIRKDAKPLNPKAWVK